MKLIMKSLTLAVSMLACSMSAYAQSNLAAIAKSLENGQSADVSYSEKRNPQTKKLVSTSLIVGVPDNKIQEVKNAFEKDRPNSTSFSKVGANVMNISFSDDEASTTYVLVTGATDPNNQSIFYGVPITNKAENVLMQTVKYKKE